jgi:cysteine-rich repeat protein
MDGDGCRADCTVELCGDGILDAGEGCDDGNATSGDGCDAACQVETAPPGPADPHTLLAFFDASVADGTLRGVGSRSLARARLRLLRWWIGLSIVWIDEGYRDGACRLLAMTEERVDGDARPHDLARGPAAPELARRIDEVRVAVGCFGEPDGHRKHRKRDRDDERHHGHDECDDRRHRH